MDNVPPKGLLTPGIRRGVKLPPQQSKHGLSSGTSAEACRPRTEGEERVERVTEAQMDPWQAPEMCCAPWADFAPLGPSAPSSTRLTTRETLVRDRHTADFR